MTKNPKTPEYASAQALLSKYGLGSGTAQALAEHEPLDGGADDGVLEVNVDSAGQQNPPAPSYEQPPAPTPAPVPPPVPAPTQPANQQTPEQIEERLKRREESAREEQRKMSRLQLEVQNGLGRIAEKEKELDAILQKAKAVPAPAPTTDPEVVAFVQENPALAEVIRKLAREGSQGQAQDQAIAAEVMQRLAAVEQTTSETSYNTRMAQVIAFVEDPTYGVPGATAIAQSDPVFEEFVKNELPPDVSAKVWQGVFVKTGDADPELLRWAFKTYRKFHPEQTTPSTPKAPASPRPPAAPNMRPANAGPVSTAAGAITPLSAEELRLFSTLVNNAGSDRAARELLFKRLAATTNS